MLSKKMAFSLTSLIVVFALAFPAVLAVHASGHSNSTYIVMVANAEGSGINIPGGVIDAATGFTVTNRATRVSERERSYQLLDMSIQGEMPNLENFFRNGGNINVYAAVDVIISEIMWGTDTSLSPHNFSQWIEIQNVSGTPSGILPIVEYIYPNQVPPPLDPLFVAQGVTLRDTAGTFNGTSLWPIVTKGRSGRSGTGEQAAGVTTVVPPTGLVSMQRVYRDDTQTTAVNGTLASGWVASTVPALNFAPTAIGERVGTPGASPLQPVTEVKKKVTRPPEAPVAGATDIMITEIMVDTSSDRFPQWIELTHVGTGEVSLDGWAMVIDNAIDAEVLGGGNAITVKLDGKILNVSKDTRNAGDGQSLLAVAWASGRKSDKIRADRVLNLAPQLGQKGRYRLLSYEGFRVSLVPPQKGAIATFGDIAGNLGEDWDLMMLEGPKRSSLIRREMLKAGTALKGTEAAGWLLASATPLVSGPETYYGDDEDAGTPGYDAGGPLPVELSHFRPARDKQTGQVVITWATQSELNNAGFFIKRSNQRNGQFGVVNPTMIAGAGTTSEKQTYTYTDTTAQPNVVYYYQIEDVSLDGNRQMLTRGIRLKGHVGAAGKATLTWGELKTSQ